MEWPMSSKIRLAGAALIAGIAAMLVFLMAFGGERGGETSPDPLPLPASAASPFAGDSFIEADVAAWLRVAPAGNEARYRIREQLLGFDFPNDAVGVTQEISGSIAVGPDGSILPAGSRLVVALAGLTSDNDRRDNYVRGGRLLQTEEFPTVELRPTGVNGLAELPASGTHSFDVLGDLTVRGVTRPSVWQVTATFAGNQLTGSAATEFTFDDFGLPKPQVRSVLSVDDTIRLEYDFDLLLEGH
jgi:polyisoprenoid-binding protein YceI